MIVYANLCCFDRRANDLEKIIRRRIPGEAEYFYNLKDLEKRLRASVYDIDAMVIHIGGASPICELLEHQNDLKELNIILILNETATKEQFSQLLKLYPRYMTYDALDSAIISLLEQRVKNNVPDSKHAGNNGITPSRQRFG